MNKILISSVGILVLALCVLISQPLPQRKLASNPVADKAALTVMITNMAKNSGGTGSILDSGLVTRVLTNSHVCEVVKNGGFVTTDSGTSYPVYSYRQSEKHDLCIIHIMSNLHLSNRVAATAPYLYDQAMVSGHPALYPTIITQGHFGGKLIGLVLTGFKPCSEADMQGPDGLACFILGGLPIIKAYEMQIVSATIMPGSSGSAVYDSTGSVAGVVFAGSGQLSYGLIVPFEYVIKFLNEEYDRLVDKYPDEKVEALGAIRRAKETCKTVTETSVKNLCVKMNSAISYE